MPSRNGSLVTSIKPKAEWALDLTQPPLCFTSYKKNKQTNKLKKVVFFFQDLLPCIISGLGRSNNADTSRVRVSDLMFLSTVRI
jgi:hypothetical protein